LPKAKRPQKLHFNSLILYHTNSLFIKQKKKKVTMFR